MNEYADEEIEVFDDWVKIRSVNHLTTLKKKKNSMYMANHLEKNILKDIKTQDIEEAFLRRDYMMDLMKIKRLAKICAERRHNYDPTCPTAYDDIAVINRLDMELLCLQMKVKLWENEHELVLPAGNQKEKTAQEATEHVFSKSQAKLRSQISQALKLRGCIQSERNNDFCGI